MMLRMLVRTTKKMVKKIRRRRISKVRTTMSHSSFTDRCQPRMFSGKLQPFTNP